MWGMFKWPVLGGGGGGGGGGGSLKFDKEHLFGFETLVFTDFSNFRDLIYAQLACYTPKIKENLKSHHMTPLMF